MHLLASQFGGGEGWRGLASFAADLVDARLTTSDYVAWGAILLGVTCGVLGCFVVLRRQSLLGDAIGHAVLPGVCVGFLLAGSKSSAWVLLGALVAGLAASGLIRLLERTTVLKPAECMGAVFTGFYAIGIVLLKNLQRSGVAGQGGLEKFLFGQIAGISAADVQLMAVVAAASLGMVVLMWRTLKLSTFDEGFARSTGVSTWGVEVLMTGLLTVAIVISIQAVGVVLVSAFLVIPAATAYLLTDRLHVMAVLSGLIGAAAGLAGAAGSLLGDNLPTGSLMVLSAAGLFAAAFLLSPRHGLLPRLRRLRDRRRRVAAENLLKTIHGLIEHRKSDADRRFGIDDVAAARNESAQQVRRMASYARTEGWIDPRSPDPLVLTDAGLEQARRVVRNHRLWELFLTREAHLAADHVHADAEYIEHVLPPDVLRRLEQMLDHPQRDPHGSPIPQVAT